MKKHWGSKKYFWFLIACFFMCHWSLLGLTTHNRNSGVVVLAHQQVRHHHKLVLRKLSFMFLPIILVCPLELLQRLLYSHWYGLAVIQMCWELHKNRRNKVRDIIGESLNKSTQPKYPTMMIELVLCSRITLLLSEPFPCLVILVLTLPLRSHSKLVTAAPERKPECRRPPRIFAAFCLTVMCGSDSRDVVRKVTWSL